MESSKVIIMLNSSKQSNYVTHYKTISLLSNISKFFQIIFLRKLQSFIENYKVIPDYQFGFLQKHFTFEHIHRIIK